MKVLIVEDDAVIRCVLSHHFISAGSEIILAENGEDGLEKFQSNNHDIDLIITDLMMPKLDGYGMAQKIRFDSNKSGTPIIAITAGFIDKSKNNNDIFNSMLQKPLDIQGLLNLSKNLIVESKKLQNHPIAS